MSSYKCVHLPALEHCYYKILYKAKACKIKTDCRAKIWNCLNGLQCTLEEDSVIILMARFWISKHELKYLLVFNKEDHKLIDWKLVKYSFLACKYVNCLMRYTNKYLLSGENSWLEICMPAYLDFLHYITLFILIRFLDFLEIQYELALNNIFGLQANHKLKLVKYFWYFFQNWRIIIFQNVFIGCKQK